MKKVILILAMSLCVISAFSGVKVTISDGISNQTVKSKMERLASEMLTEVTDAQSQGRKLDLEHMNVDNTVRQSMGMLWATCPFRCTDTDIVEHCIQTGTGYQIRNLPLMMIPKQKGVIKQDYQEAVISFDRNGNVESFYLSIANHLYQKVISENNEITDLRRRQIILDYVEHFRTAYNQKDIVFLEQVYSEDALIITGRVIKQQKDNMKLPDKVVYNKQSKQQYISKLRSIFKNNQNINVTFSDIKLIRHPTNPNFYGVTLRQGWSTDKYSDDGYLFLLWDFTDESKPQIHVRTWQPSEYNGKEIPEDEIFTLGDFDI